MLIYAGIDEAGYGPMLGPLCVACTVFSVRDHDPERGAPNLWSLLNAAITRSKNDKKSRIAVEDSKSLIVQGGDPCERVRHLERGVLSFVSACGELPADCSAFFRMVGADQPSQRWYASTSPLPVANRPDELRIAAAMLHRAMQKAGVALELLRCEAIDADAFNQQVRVTNSKASVNFASAMRLVDGIWNRWREAHPRIVIDRHGGRTHYREDLQLCYPDAQIVILDESDRMSRYELTRGRSQVTITFTTESESLHLPAALASMTAKYTRELMMIRMNRYFKAMMPELKPTAGYTQDARRYLADIEPICRREAIDLNRLVRSR